MKRIVLSLMLLLPLSMVAQEGKIAVVNFMEVINAMPEVSVMESELMALQQRWQAELQTLENDHNRKYSDYINQQDSLNDNIKTMRIQEIEDLKNRYENLLQMAQQDTEKKRDELFTPIQEKVLNAIKEVGDDNSYSIVLPHNSLLYVGKSTEDATAKVKAKLGLK